MDGKMVQRADKVAFLGSKGTGDTFTYNRMRGFTDTSISKNAKEYNRQYVDENFEETDVTGYSPSISYAFDQYVDNPVHNEIARITDGELTGADAIVPIIMVDMTKDGTTAGTKVATKRDFAVIPDSEGDSTDAYTYSGNMKVKSGKTTGTATSADDWETITFTEDVQA